MFSLSLGSWGFVWCADKASSGGEVHSRCYKGHSLAFTLLHALRMI